MADPRSTTATPRPEPRDRSGSSGRFDPDGRPETAGRFDPDEHPICADPATPLEVTYYVRGDVSTPSRRQIESVQRRLDALEETRLVAEVHTERWPPRRHAVGSEEDTETCAALVDRLERWADEAGYSLRPAVRRRAPELMLDDEPSDPGVCVPVMLLALERATPKSSGLAGVVPYTVPDESGGTTTYTVADWLAAAERTVGTDPERSRDRTRISTPSRQR